MDTVGLLTAAVLSYKHLQFQFDQSTEIQFNSFFEQMYLEEFGAGWGNIYFDKYILVEYIFGEL